MIGGYRNVSNLGTGQQLREIHNIVIFCTTGAVNIFSLHSRNGGNKVKKGKEIEKVAEEAAKILKDYPKLKYSQAIALAKAALRYGEKYRKKP